MNKNNPTLIYLQNKLEIDLLATINNARQKWKLENETSVFERFFIVEVICNFCEEMKQTLLNERDNLGLTSTEIEKLFSELSFKMRLEHASD